MFCPGCGTRTEGGRNKALESKKRTKERSKAVPLLGIAAAAILCVGLWIGNRKKEANGNSNRVTEVTVADIEETTAVVVAETTQTSRETDAPSLEGVWKCEQGEVTFTENGHLMLGKDGIALGGGWLEYEVIDNSTLYVSGGDMPVGMNVGYELDGDYLYLDLYGGMLLTK